MTAAFTFEADVGAEAHNSPLERAAGMGFAQAQQIVEPEIRKHVE